MSNKGILEKAIQKAIDGGWSPFFVNWHQYKITDDAIWGDQETCEHADFERVIFDHDFAKALWPDPDGEDEPHEINGNTVTVPGVHWWQYHLQAMVISPDPIKYLGEHLND